MLNGFSIGCGGDQKANRTDAYTVLVVSYCDVRLKEFPYRRAVHTSECGLGACGDWRLWSFTSSASLDRSRSQRKRKDREMVFVSI